MKTINAEIVNLNTHHCKCTISSKYFYANEEQIS